VDPCVGPGTSSEDNNSHYSSWHIRRFYHVCVCSGNDVITSKPVL
jgi:hypothetical protein